MKAFVTMSVLAVSAMTATVSSAAVVFNEDFSGPAGTIGAPWTGNVLLTGSGTAVRLGTVTNAVANTGLSAVGATDTLRLDLTIGALGPGGRIGAAFHSDPLLVDGSSVIAASSLSINVLNSPSGGVRLTRPGNGFGAPFFVDLPAAGVVSGDTVSLVVDLGADTLNVLKNNVALNASPVALGFDLTPALVDTLIIELGNNAGGSIDNITVSATPIPEPTSALAIGALGAIALRRRGR